MKARMQLWIGYMVVVIASLILASVVYYGGGSQKQAILIVIAVSCVSIAVPLFDFPEAFSATLVSFVVACASVVILSFPADIPRAIVFSIVILAATAIYFIALFFTSDYSDVPFWIELECLCVEGLIIGLALYHLTNLKLVVGIAFLGIVAITTVLFLFERVEEDTARSVSEDRKEVAT